MVVVSLALAAAACYAVAMVVQQRCSREIDPRLSLRPGLVGDLARRPLWLGGIAANAVGYGLRFIALGRGSLVVVQPLLAASLVFALALASRWDRVSLRALDWVGAVIICGGLAIFLVAAAPAIGRTRSSGAAGVVAVTATAFAAAGAVLAAAHWRSQRAAFLAAGGGVLLGLTATLTKATAALVESHRLGAAAAWEPWTLIAVGFAAVVVVQSAFAAGPLSSSLPVLMVTEPVASVVFAVALFGERLAATMQARVGEGLGMALALAGIVLLTRSPLVVGVSVEAPS